MAFKGIKSALSRLHSAKNDRSAVFDAAAKAKELLEQGDMETASEILVEAMELYPGHSSLEHIKHFLGQKCLHDSLAKLNHTIESARKMYIRAARALADTGNEKKTIDFILGAFRRFPECADLHLVLGQTYLQRYIADMIPTDGMQAIKNLERADQLDGQNLTSKKYLAGLYARIGMFDKAAKNLALIDDTCADEQERKYVQELHAYCLNHTIGRETDVSDCLTEVWEHGEFALDCEDWGRPATAKFGKCDMSDITVPIKVLDLIAQKLVNLPGLAAIVVQNQARSETIRSSGETVEVASLENVVREVYEKSVEACRQMKLGHVRRFDLKTTLGRICLTRFADTWVGLVFKPDVSAKHGRTVTQQFVDTVTERLGELNENNS